MYVLRNVPGKRKRGNRGMNNLTMTTEQADELQLVETEDEELMMEG